MFKKIVIHFIPLVFDFLNQKVLVIAHPQLRQFAKQIVSDCQAFAELMLNNDLTDAATAQKVFEAQMPTILSVMPMASPYADVIMTPAPILDTPLKVSYDEADVPPVFNDLPTNRRKKAVLKNLEIPRIKAQ